MNSKIFIFFAIAFTLFSCTSDSNDGTSGNYLPLNTGNFWKYSISDSANPTLIKDSLYIANDTIIDGSTFKKFKARNFPLGLYSNSLNKNGVKETGNSVVVTGSSNLGLQDLFALNIDLVNFVLLNSNATTNTVLNTVSGTINQTYEGIPITIIYTLKSVSDGNLSNYVLPNGTSYSDIVKTKLTVTLSVSSTQTIPGTNFPVVIPIINTQDVLVSSQYYAKDIGMIYTKTNIDVTLNAAVASQLDLPVTNSQEQIEFLSDFEIN